MFFFLIYLHSKTKEKCTKIVNENLYISVRFSVTFEHQKNIRQIDMPLKSIRKRIF